MKRKLLLLGGIFSFLLLSLSSLAQNTQLDLNFDDGQPRFVAINANSGDPSFTLSVTGGILKIAVNKKVNDWSFLQLWNPNLNMASLPSLQFLVKSDVATTMYVRFKSAKLSNPAEDAQIELAHALTPGDFTYYYYDLSSLIAGNSDFNPGLVKEIQIDISNGWTDSTSGNVWLDYFRVGYAQQVPSSGNGFMQRFNSGMPSGLASTADHTLNISGQALQVNVNRNQRWVGFDYDLGASYNISSKPYLNMKVKADQDMVMQAFLIDADGKGYQVSLVGGQYNYNELVGSGSEYRRARVFKSAGFNDVCFDFTGATIIDLTRIAKIKVIANGTALTFNGRYFIDDLALGDSARRFANVGQIPDYHFYAGNQAQLTILVPEVANADHLELSSSTLLSNIQIDPVTYEARVENGKPATYGYSRIRFNLNGTTGSEQLTLTAVGKTGFENNEVRFNVIVSGNMPPTINPVDSMVVKTGKEYSVKLTGITDGDRDIEQNVVLRAYADNSAVTGNLQTVYTSGYRSGWLKFTPQSAGTAHITVYAVDSENDSTGVAFKVMAYSSLNNPPAVADIASFSVLNNAGQQVLKLHGISDGDNNTQTLTITAVSSNPAVIPDPVIVYNQGDSTAELRFTPVAGQHGKVTITLTLADNGGTAENDGDKTTVKTFEIESLVPPVTEYEIDLNDPNILSRFSPEQNGVIYFLAVVDTLGEKALRITFKNKWTYAGIWLQLPMELDLSGMPVVSYEVFSKDKSTWHWNYLYDALGTDGNINRNIQNSSQHQYEVTANAWKTLSFDYRHPGDLNNSEGNPIEIRRINALLINLHDAKPSWPFTNASGVVYYRKIRFGTKASYEPLVPDVTIDPVAPQNVYAGSGQHTLTLTGISDGKGNHGNVTIAAASSNTTLMPNPSVSSADTTGKATLTFVAGNAGTVTVTLNVSAQGSNSKTLTFKINVISSDPAQQIHFSIDRSQKFQTIRGFGTFQTEPRLIDVYTAMGSSAVRIGIIGNQWEPVNDNEDPNVMNMAGFNYNAFNWDYFRSLKERGVQTFIITSWSPPAWMKRNLSLDHREEAQEWEKTDNILDPVYYEEFAESMAAVVKAFKEEAGIDITAIGLQNEPYFNEPYPSAILSGPKFAELIKIVGDRFHREGLDHVGFYMPEQVFGIGWGDYSNEGYLAAVRALPDADKYTTVFAVHGYDGTGITPGFPSYSNWSNLYNLAIQEPNPKEMWMTETHIAYTGWSSAMSLAGALHGSLIAGNITLWTNWSFEDMQLTSNEPNLSYYVSKQFFAHIKPGAVRVYTSPEIGDLMGSAYENTDGSFTLVMINKGSSPIRVRLVGAGLPLSYQVFRTSSTEKHVDAGVYQVTDGALILPASSVSTLVSSQMPALALGQVANVKVAKNSGEATVTIPGISDANGQIAGLTLTAENDNPSLFSQFEISAINPDHSAALSFTPAQDQTGSAKVTLTLRDDQNNEVQTIFYIIVYTPQGINEGKTVTLSLYPNPASSVVRVTLPSTEYKTITMTDLTGRTIFRTNVNSMDMDINLTGIPKGIYVVQAEGNGKSVRSRLVVQ